MPVTLAHASQRARNAGAETCTIRHRGTRRARLERHHAKVAAFNWLRVVMGGEHWNRR